MTFASPDTAGMPVDDLVVYNAYDHALQIGEDLPVARTDLSTFYRVVPGTRVRFTIFFQNDAVSLCLLMNRRAKTMRVIDFRAGPSNAKRQFVLSLAQREGIEKVYTLVPEKFSLPELFSGVRTSFKGTLVRGHFERGGSPFLTNVTVKVKRVVFQKKFDPMWWRPNPQTWRAGSLLSNACAPRPISSTSSTCHEVW